MRVARGISPEHTKRSSSSSSARTPINPAAQSAPVHTAVCQLFFAQWRNFAKKAASFFTHFCRVNSCDRAGSGMAIPFDFTSAMRLLCDDIASRVPEFTHVRMEQVAVTFAQARRGVPHGLQAKLTPMRFEGGALTTHRSGRLWTIPRWYAGNVEVLYLLTFYLPRFLDQSFREKMITIMHELYHISPAFDGDIRRLHGRCHVHSHSQKAYDLEMDRIVERYLQKSPPESLWSFLRSGFRDLQERHGSVVGLRVPIPKLVPMSKSA
jgi:predicted metallopeptidase